jgi:FkbM family methyltransferase
MPNHLSDQPYLAQNLPPSAQLCRDIPVRPRLSFQIVIGTEADDPFSQAFVQGKYPSGPLTELMFQLIRPGDAVLDLGAHVGTFSLAAAALGCRVVSVEASPRNTELLRASVQCNGFDNMRVVHGAVTDYQGVLKFMPNGPHGVVFNPIVDLPSVTVPAITVDQILEEIGWQRVDFIKMDVEGSEIAAVRGMRHLLAGREAPPILYESNGHTLRFFGKTANELKRTLKQLGYHNHQVEQGVLIPVRDRDLQPFGVVDYLAFKRRPARLTGWRMRKRLSRTELLERFVFACAYPHQHVRAHAARELARAPRWLLTRPAIQNALTALRNDPLAEVREAASWSISCKPKFASIPRSIRRIGKPVVALMRRVRQRVSEHMASRLRRSA